jgi:hypothetical protein
MNPSLPCVKGLRIEHNPAAAVGCYILVPLRGYEFMKSL